LIGKDVCIVGDDLETETVKHNYKMTTKLWLKTYNGPSKLIILNWKYQITTKCQHSFNFNVWISSVKIINQNSQVKAEHKMSLNMQYPSN